MNKSQRMWTMILLGIVVACISSVVVFPALESTFARVLMGIILVFLTGLMIYGGLQEYNEIPMITGSVRYESSKGAVLFWGEVKLKDHVFEEYIIHRKCGLSAEFLEVGRTYANTFTDSSVNPLETNYYQVFAGKDALEGKNRRCSAVFELKSNKK